MWKKLPCIRLFSRSLCVPSSCPSSERSRLLLLPPCTTDPRPILSWNIRIKDLTSFLGYPRKIKPSCNYVLTFCLATLAHSWKVLSCSLSAGILARVWIKGNSNVYNGLRCIAMKSKNFHKGSLSDPWPIKPVWEWLGPVELIWFPISRIVLATRYHSVFKWLSKQTIRIFNPEIG